MKKGSYVVATFRKPRWFYFRFLEVLTLFTGFAAISLAQVSVVPQVNAAVNAASFNPTGPLSPGVLFAIFGTSLTNGATASASSTPLPTSLAGATVLVDNVPAPLIFVSPSQINAQFPVNLTGIGTANIQVQVQSAAATETSPSLTVAVKPFSPGIFTWNQSGAGPGAVLRNRDFSKICPQGRNDCATNFAVPGEVLAIYATGLGPVAGSWSSGEPASEAFPTVATPIVSINGQRAEVLFAGLAPGFVGLYQVNVVVPSTVATTGSVPLFVAGGEPFPNLTYSNTVSFATGTPPSPQSVIPNGGGPPGGEISAIAIDPAVPSTVYAGTAGMGIFKSTDGGTSWRGVNLGLKYGFISALAFDPSNSSTLYASASNGGVFKSTDGGTSWNEANDGLVYVSGLTNPYIDRIVVDPVNPSTLYISSTDLGIRKSTDKAATWNVTGLAVAYRHSFILDPSNPSTLYAMDSLGIRKSTNGGSTWSVNAARVSIAGESRPVTLLEVDPTSSNTMYGTATSSQGVALVKSTDGGASWTLSNAGLVNSFVHTLAITRSNPAILYAGTDAGVFKSNNGGVNWSAASTGLANRAVHTLALHSGTSTTLYAGTIGGIFKTTNGATDWGESSRGITSTTALCLAINPVNPAQLYSGTRGSGVFRSMDHGMTWNAINAGLSDFIVNSIAIDRSNPAIVYVGTAEGGVFKSTIGGGSWIAINTVLGEDPPPLTRVNALLLDPSNPQVLYAGGNGAHKSTNGGATWSALNLPGDVNFLAVNPLNSSILYAATEQGVFKTTNGGASWTVTNGDLLGGVRAVAVDPVNPATIYAASGDGVFRSTNSGVTWNSLNAVPGESAGVVAIDPRNPSTVYAGTAPTGIFKSTDAGASWMASSEGITNLYMATTGGYLDRFVYSIAIDPSNSATLYAGTEAQGVYKSTNGGQTWQPTGAN